MLKLQKFEVNPFGENTYLVWDDTTGDGALVDPGMVGGHEEEVIDGFIRQNNIRITDIINTHLHLDHIFGVNATKERYNIGLSAHAGDAPLAADLPGQVARFRLPINARPVSIDRELHDGDKIRLGSYDLEVIEVPGHSPGGLAFYSKDGCFVLTGDSLFNGSVGRTDLPGGSQRQLVDSIRQKLLSLPDDTYVYPGHGPRTTIGTEKIYNPYL